MAELHPSGKPALLGKAESLFPWPTGEENMRKARPTFSTTRSLHNTLIVWPKLSTVMRAQVTQGPLLSSPSPTARPQETSFCFAPYALLGFLHIQCKVPEASCASFQKPRPFLGMAKDTKKPSGIVHSLSPQLSCRFVLRHPPWSPLSARADA